MVLGIVGIALIAIGIGFLVERRQVDSLNQARMRNAARIAALLATVDDLKAQAGSGQPLTPPQQQELQHVQTELQHLATSQPIPTTTTTQGRRSSTPGPNGAPGPPGPPGPPGRPGTTTTSSTTSTTQPRSPCGTVPVIKVCVP